MTTEQLAVKLERINVLSDILYTLLAGDPRAQVLVEMIMETSDPF